METVLKHKESSKETISKRITGFCKICPANKNKGTEILPFCDFISNLFIDLMLENIDEKEALKKECPYYVENILYKENK